MRWRVLPIVAAVLLWAAPVVRAQRLADAPTRRAAIALYRTGRELMSAEKFDGAAEAFTKAIEKDPLLTVAHFGLGQAYMNLRRFASAIKAYQGCIQAASTLHTLAQSDRFEVEKQRDMEIHELRETVALFQQAGHTLQAMQAEQHLHDLERQGTSIAGPFRPPAEVLLSLGSAYFRNGDLPSAEREWREAIAVNPRLGEAHNNLAALYAMSGKKKEAEQEMKAAEKSGFRVNPGLKDEIKRLPTS